MSAKSSKQDKGRFTSKRKQAAVLRLLRGEDLDTLSRELGGTAARLSQWRGEFWPPVRPGSRAASPIAAMNRSRGSRRRWAS